MSNLEDDWTVVTMAITSDFKQLILSRWNKCQESPVIVRVPLTDKNGEGDFNYLFDIQETLSSVIHTSLNDGDQINSASPQTNNSSENDAKWWEMRKKQDATMNSLVNSKIPELLGLYKIMLLGTLNEEGNNLQSEIKKEIKDLEKKLSKEKISHEALYIIINSLKTLNESDITLLQEEFFGHLSKINKKEIEIFIKRMNKFIKDKDTEYSNVILILDKHLQNLPWECTPSLNERPVTRMPSLFFIKLQTDMINQSFTRNFYCKGINPENTYFILNPSQDLIVTQQRFEASFKGYIFLFFNNFHVN